VDGIYLNNTSAEGVNISLSAVVAYSNIIYFGNLVQILVVIYQTLSITDVPKIVMLKEIFLVPKFRVRIIFIYLLIAILWLIMMTVFDILCQFNLFDPIQYLLSSSPLIAPVNSIMSLVYLWIVSVLKSEANMKIYKMKYEKPLWCWFIISIILIIIEFLLTELYLKNLMTWMFFIESIVNIFILKHLFGNMSEITTLVFKHVLIDLKEYYSYFFLNAIYILAQNLITLSGNLNYYSSILLFALILNNVGNMLKNTCKIMLLMKIHAKELESRAIHPNTNLENKAVTTT